VIILIKSIVFSFILVGTFVGAGFATGQEMLSFFNLHSKNNPLFFIVSVAVVFMTVIFTQKSYGKSVKEYYIYLFGKNFGEVMYIVSLLSLFICYGASAAGMGSLFYESLSLPYLSGAALLSVISFTCCFKGMKGINILNTILTPVIIISVIIFGSLSAAFPYRQLISFRESYTVPFIYSLLYAGYNIFPLIPLALSHDSKNKGAYIAFGFTVICGTALFFSISSNLSLAFSSSVPFQSIIGTLFPKMKNIYLFTVCAALITTGSSCLYGFISPSRKHRKLLYILCALMTFVFLFFGFTGTVRIFYPLSGMFGVVLILKIFISNLFKK